MKKNHSFMNRDGPTTPSSRLKSLITVLTAISKQSIFLIFHPPHAVVGVTMTRFGYSL